MKELYIIDNKIGRELIYWIGESAQDNWDIIDLASQNDIWFHLADHPSAHVILRMEPDLDRKAISKQTLIHCAAQCKLHSKFSNISSKQKMRAIYTEVKNVSKGDKPGAVYTKKVGSILI
jgi:predicted ribosome quality control (RQC) complex YloA/Tae2 family protein